MTGTLEVHEEVQALGPEWDALADRANATPFLRPGWIAAWYQAFGRGEREILALRRDGRLVAVLPMERRRGALFSPTNYHTPEFGPVFDDDDALDELAGAVYASDRARRVSLAFLDGRSPIGERLKETAVQRRYRVREWVLERPPSVRVQGGWSDYDQRLGSKRRSNLNRLWRRLEDRGAVSVDVADGKAGLDRLLREGYAVEASGWKGRAGTAIASSPETRLFYDEAARWAAARGCLVLAFLRLDSRPLAFDFCIEESGVHYLLKTGYDPAYRSFAPGLLLRRRMIARAFEQGLNRYDFLGVDTEWKSEWTDESRPLDLLESFAPSLSGTAWWLSWRYARPAFNRVRDRLRPR
jgi:CelD/BcsL family acetyltransferase involved in cellulose biosynthesis